ncbi:Glycosyltransferase involved in cell wall bisynthesis [Rhizobiales bacterium GAS188]|nr:Glycosyltransferase involved in cell wall bisynthesis [Rhizobiales bacterium GAS188]
MALSKLVFYIHSLGRGGAERVIALLASGFARRGVECIVAVEVEARENRAFLDPRVRLVNLGAHHGRATLKFAKLLAEERPDISLSALGVRNLKHVVAAAIAGRLPRAILSYHGHVEAEPRFLDRVSNRLTPLTTRLAARTICVSDWMRRHVVQDLHGSSRRAVTIYNPVSIEAAHPAAHAAELSRRDPVILAVGRLEPVKDFALLIAAFASLEQPRAKLVIIGEGPQRAALEAQARKLGVAERVEMPGYVDEPWDRFASARVCAISSLSESFSNVAVEALAHGLPVVSTDCGGPAEIISRPQEGVLVPVGDEAALAAALQAALEDPGDPAPRVARAEVFSIDRAVEAYERLFEEVASEAGGQAHGG